MNIPQNRRGLFDTRSTQLQDHLNRNDYIKSAHILDAIVVEFSATHSDLRKLVESKATRYINYHELFSHMENKWWRTGEISESETDSGEGGWRFSPGEKETITNINLKKVNGNRNWRYDSKYDWLESKRHLLYIYRTADNLFMLINKDKYLLNESASLEELQCVAKKLKGYKKSIWNILSIV